MIHRNAPKVTFSSLLWAGVVGRKPNPAAEEVAIGNPAGYYDRSHARFSEHLAKFRDCCVPSYFGPWARLYRCAVDHVAPRISSGTFMRMPVSW